MYNVFPPDSTDVRFDSIAAARHAFVAPKYRVCYLFTYSELVNSAASMAYVQGRTAADPDPAVQSSIHQWFDIEEPANSAIIKAAADLAFSEAEHVISAISTGRIDDHRSYDMHLHPQLEYVTEIVASAETPDTVLHNLGIMIRQYVVDSMLAKWAALANPNALQYWEAQRLEHLEAVRDAGLHCQPKTISLRKFPAW